MARMQPGVRIPISVEDLAKMWHGHIVVIMTDDGEKYKAKVDGSVEGGLVVMVAEKGAL